MRDSLFTHSRLLGGLLVFCIIVVVVIVFIFRCCSWNRRHTKSRAEKGICHLTFIRRGIRNMELCIHSFKCVKWSIHDMKSWRMIFNIRATFNRKFPFSILYRCVITSPLNKFEIDILNHWPQWTCFFFEPADHLDNVQRMECHMNLCLSRFPFDYNDNYLILSLCQEQQQKQTKQE